MRYDLRSTKPGYTETSVRRRSDAARLWAARMAYDMLAGIGLLDRPVAHHVMAEIDRWDGRESMRFHIDAYREVLINVSQGD